ncbi:hypothetical protein PYCC9005_000250 [Savitreella phatthalungensis]
MESYLRLREVGANPASALRNAQNVRLFHGLSPDPLRRFRKLKSGSINALAFDAIEQRWLLSGNGDSSINLYDADAHGGYRRLTRATTSHFEAAPTESLSARTAHIYGVSDIHWHPFDTGLFTTSSYDGTCKVWDTATFSEACKFDLGSKVYAHDASASPGADHSLLACACELPAVRLCDLRTGTAAHMLAGHRGAVCTVGWSPTQAYVLATGGTDGTLRLWDVRRADGALALLDRDNAGVENSNDRRERNAYQVGYASAAGKLPTAHADICNGLAWTADGLHIVSTGHDNKLRLWDSARGCNMLVNYGTWPLNTHWQQVRPLVIDSFTGQVEPEEALLFYPSDEGTVLRYGLTTGYLFGKHFVLNGRVTCLAHRGPGSVPELYAGDSSGQILRLTATELDPAAEDEQRRLDVGSDDTRADALRRIHDESRSLPVTFS